MDYVTSMYVMLLLQLSELTMSNLVHFQELRSRQKGFLDNVSLCLQIIA